ncbi:DNA helicase MCM8 [Eurytemora carolleeae]|uniref:DNA helicase MCM8 n=1 Tax=Eurytemora carolleeae TaxID=1294199 RepID=UPI000C770498|nr:DNA helicase MCM8 [Eurytemora carolleeae]|eukprot:XP_023328015.1 DNA helicase MCM8-like [Eurytemora affinis]
MSGRGGWRGRGGGWRGGGGWRSRAGGRGGGWRGRSKQQDSTSDISRDSNKSLSNDSRISDYYETVGCPYKAWRHYLPDIPFNPAASIIGKLKCAVWYLERNEKTQREKLFDKGFFSVNMDKMITDECVLEAWPRVKDELEEKAERVCAPDEGRGKEIIFK